MGFINNKKILLSSLGLVVGLCGVNVLGGLSSIGSIFFDSKAYAQSSSQQSTFDNLIQKYGAIKKGKVRYASFSKSFNPTLHQAIQAEFREYNNSNSTYSYFEVDINSDGRKDAFVQRNDSLGAGTGGSHTWVFVARDNGYELVNVFRHQVTLVVLPNKSYGFRDILVVPGKIFTPDNPEIFYQKCSFNPQKSPQTQWRSSSPQHYRGCQNIQRGSVVSGIVIETPTFRRNPPEFGLL